MLFAQIFNWSQGNPGALNFLMELLAPQNLEHALPIAMKLTESEKIRGTNLYVLYSDLCGENMANVAILCKNCPTDVLEDACSRQDYSGRKLVEQYLS